MFSIIVFEFITVKNIKVWRQTSSTAGICDWPLSSRIANGVDCGEKQMYNGLKIFK